MIKCDLTQKFSIADIMNMPAEDLLRSLIEKAKNNYNISDGEKELAYMLAELVRKKQSSLVNLENRIGLIFVYKLNGEIKCSKLCIGTSDVAEEIVNSSVGKVLFNMNPGEDGIAILNGKESKIELIGIVDSEELAQKIVDLYSNIKNRLSSITDEDIYSMVNELRLIQESNPFLLTPLTRIGNCFVIKGKSGVHFSRIVLGDVDVDQYAVAFDSELGKIITRTKLGEWFFYKSGGYSRKYELLSEGDSMIKSVENAFKYLIENRRKKERINVWGDKKIVEQLTSYIRMNDPKNQYAIVGSFVVFKYNRYGNVSFAKISLYPRKTYDNTRINFAYGVPLLFKEF